MLKAGLAMLGVAALPMPGPAADSGVIAWLQKRRSELPELAVVLQFTNRILPPDRTERNSAIENYSRYVTVIEWSPGIVYCVAVCFSSRETPALFARAKTIAWQAGARVVAEGWTDDRRVAGFFATGDAAKVESLMRAVAPPESHYWRYNDARNHTDI